MILATHSPPTWVLPLLFLYSLPRLHFCRWLAVLPEGGPRVQGWGRTGCSPALALPLPAGTWSRGWAELCLGHLASLGALDFCGFILVEPKNFSLMKIEWLFAVAMVCSVCASQCCTILPKWSGHLRICVSQGCSKGLLCLCLALKP